MFEVFGLRAEGFELWVLRVEDFRDLGLQGFMVQG
jgi:hypothetical protein